MQIAFSFPSHTGTFLLSLWLGCFLFHPSIGLADDFNAKLYADLLQEYTRQTESLPGTIVDYKGLKAEERWSQLVKNLESTNPNTLSTAAGKQAYWLNAYNILAIDTVIQNYPIKSIRDAGSLFSPVWKHQGIEIAGQPFSLSHIEHNILRPMGDPRVHAGIVCASRSCPSLLREPWVEEKLDQQLDDAMRAWLGDEKKGLRIDPDSNEVRVSRIFKWFSEDFAGLGGIQRILIQYGPPEANAWLRKNRGNFTLQYFPYDWNLNQ